MWELDVEGHVLSQWTGRTVIRSCAKLAYHHAQTIIEADEARQAQAEEAPVPLESPHTWAQASFCAIANSTLCRPSALHLLGSPSWRTDHVYVRMKTTELSCLLVMPESVDRQLLEGCSAGQK